MRLAWALELEVRVVGYETNDEGETDGGWAVEEHIEPGRRYRDDRTSTDGPVGNIGCWKVVIVY